MIASDRYLVTTHFQPTSARSAFPCWDEPQYKARFKIAAVRQRNYVALSNMPLDNTEDVSIFWGSGLVNAFSIYFFENRARIGIFKNKNIQQRHLAVEYRVSYLKLLPISFLSSFLLYVIKVQDNFHESVAMSTYLVALVVSDYARIQDMTKTGVTLSVYVPPHMTGQAQFALNVAVKLFDYFQSFFGVAYPLPKLDLISMPDFAAGM